MPSGPHGQRASGPEEHRNHGNHRNDRRPDPLDDPATAIRHHVLVNLLPGNRGRDAADPVRTRLVATGAAVLIVGAGLGLRIVTVGSVAKYGGDALYTVLLLALFVVVAPRTTPLRAAAVALTVSWAVEFLQLSAIPAGLSGRSTIARLVLGSTFNAPDLLWYVVGAAAGCLAHTALTSFPQRRRREAAERSRRA